MSEEITRTNYYRLGLYESYEMLRRPGPSVFLIPRLRPGAGITYSDHYYRTYDNG